MVSPAFLPQYIRIPKECLPFKFYSTVEVKRCLPLTPGPTFMIICWKYDHIHDDFKSHLNAMGGMLQERVPCKSALNHHTCPTGIMHFYFIIWMFSGINDFAWLGDLQFRLKKPKTFASSAHMVCISFIKCVVFWLCDCILQALSLAKKSFNICWRPQV